MKQVMRSIPNALNYVKEASSKWTGLTGGKNNVQLSVSLKVQTMEKQSPLNATSAVASPLKEVESTSTAAIKSDKEQVEETFAELVESHEQPKAIQQPLFPRHALSNSTRNFIKVLEVSPSSTSYRNLVKHLINHPEQVSIAIEEGGIRTLKRQLHKTESETERETIRMTLSILGYTEPPKGRGIRILSIDGGGMRGIVILEILRKLEQLTGKPIWENFDVFCGTSTGAILSTMIGGLRIEIPRCDLLYRQTSKQLFSSSVMAGTKRLLLTHAYYDTTNWENILKSIYEEKPLIATAKSKISPKLMIISASMSSPRLTPFVFRNYNLPPGSFAQYTGSSQYKMWEAVRASSSAPGYFEDTVLGGIVHSDGGILINNPTGIAIHEAQCIWPNEKIQCVVSIGTGKFTPTSQKNYTGSIKEKITSLIDSATDTEIIHRLCQDLLPQGTYYRMNPQLSEWLSLDENRDDKLEQMRTDAQMYCRKNEYKMVQAAEAISGERSYFQMGRDMVNDNLVRI